MSDFRALSDGFLASPQVTIADIEEARSIGVIMIVNNRPEGEAEDQTSGPAIEAAARSAGMKYVAIPVSPGSFNESQVHAMIEVLDQAEGRVLAYCRSGTRSTLLWALARAATGAPLETISAAASAAGYDVSPVLPAMQALAGRARS
jgi:uncharacterized protein (TIGR01244 family)